MIVKKMLSRDWLMWTILVVLASLVCIRLGIWQLSRLQERRAFNAQVLSMQSASVLDLNKEVPENILSMEWRAVQVQGKYDFANQIAVRNQYYNGQFGYNLITPLLFSGKAVLVDRGWIPADGNSAAQDWHKYDVEGDIQLEGQIRLQQAPPLFGSVPEATLMPGQTRLEFWNLLELKDVAAQLPYPVLSIYIQQKYDPADQTPPIPYQTQLDLSEGPHMGYALQWFSFALIIFIGYLYYLRKQIRGESK